MVELAAGAGPTNVFCYYSGHGTSVSGKLHITLPTVLSSDEYASLKHDLMNIVPFEDLKSLLINFSDLKQRVGSNFREKEMKIVKEKILNIDSKAHDEL
jgi:hypothetical protein